MKFDSGTPEVENLVWSFVVVFSSSLVTPCPECMTPDVFLLCSCTLYICTADIITVPHMQVRAAMATCCFYGDCQCAGITGPHLLNRSETWAIYKKTCPPLNTFLTMCNWTRLKKQTTFIINIKKIVELLHSKQIYPKWYKYLSQVWGYNYKTQHPGPNFIELL